MNPREEPARRDPFALARPAPPDADWPALRERALAGIDGSWSDHNLSDPGITVLEAGLWSLADLHYRTAARFVGAWHAEAAARAPGGSRVHAPLDGLTSAQRAQVARVLATHGEVLRTLTDAAASEDAAVVALLDQDFGGVTLTDLEARAAVHLARRAAFERHARDRAALVAAAVDEQGWDEAAEALARHPRLGGLWPSELEALVQAERWRRLVRLLADDSTGVRDSVERAGWAAAIDTLQATFDLDVSGSQQAAAVHACPEDATAEDFEDADGSTRVWPPHPLQARTVEPVTAGDYRRLALALPAVARAWVAEGLLAGIDWNSRERKRSLPYRQGGITLVVQPVAGALPGPLPEPGMDLTDEEADFLRDVLRQALALPGETAEVDAPYARFRDDLDVAAPRRLIGDELAAALLKARPVVVKGVLHIDPAATREGVLAEAESLLDGFLSADRTVPDAREAPAATPPDVHCPSGIEGTWPVPAEPPAGWPPGSPVRVSELVELLSGIDGVAGVESAAARHGTTGEWTEYSIELAADAVPRYGGHCLRVRAIRSRVCDD